MSNKRKPKYGLPNDNDPMHIFHLTTIEATRLQMPKFNGHAIGHGPHGDAKYNRKKEKAALKRLLSEERW